MNLLYLCHRIPYPPDKGDKIRSFHQIRHLAQRHRVHLACMIDQVEDLQGINELKHYCAAVDTVYRSSSSAKTAILAALLTNKSLSVASFHSKQLQKKIAERLASEHFDRIFVFSSTMAEYVWDVNHIPRIMDFVDVDSEKWRDYAGYHSFPRSLIYRQEAVRLAHYEERISLNFDHSIFVSEAEANLFRRRINHRPISVVPNGVDFDYFAQRVASPVLADGPVIIFVGAMDYFPNIDAVRYFCKDIFPLVRKSRPEARFYIVGSRPAREVIRLGRIANVKVTGWVPDVRPYLAMASVSVAPFRIARGIQNKILEAMASGVPVVSTSRAVQGIGASAKDGLRIEDEPGAFARQILRLLDAPQLGEECAQHARDYVCIHHQWQQIGKLIEDILQAVPAPRS